MTLFKQISIVMVLFIFMACEKDTVLQSESSDVDAINAQGKHYFTKAYNSNKEGNLKEALLYYHESLGYYEKANNKIKISSCYANIGVLFKNCRDNNKALEFFHESLSIKKRYEEGSFNHAMLLRNMARSFRALKEYDSAFAYYRSADVLFKEQKNTKYQSRVANEIGICYKEQGNFKEAKRYYDLSVILDPSDARKANYHNNLGNIYLEKEWYKKALSSFNMALNYYEASDASSQKIALCFRNISSCFTNDQQQQIEYLEKALSLEKRMDTRQGILLELADLYKNQGKNNLFQEALTEVATLSKGIRERTTIFDEKYQAIQLESAILEIKNRELKQARSEQFERNAWTYSFSSCVFVIVLFYILWRVRRKHAQIQKVKRELLGELNSLVLP